jgi:bacillithiol system protein YtxJ
MLRRLLTEAELASALSAPRFLLFKHSPTCPVSAAAFAEYERWARAHPDFASGWIDVVQERALARAVAERTGIRHESPQALLLAAGEPRWHAAHHAITAAGLGEAAGGLGAVSQPSRTER